MHKLALIIFLSLCLVLTGFSQISDIGIIGNTGNGGIFTKTVEYNLLNSAIIISNGKESKNYNCKSKTDIEKLFFGNVNSAVEFFVEPSFEGACGFRIITDSLNNCLVETKRISNFEKVTKDLETDFPSAGIPAEKISTTTKKKVNANAKYNRRFYEIRKEESLRRYEISSRLLPVNQEFAKHLHDVFTKTIDNFTGKGAPELVFDGRTVTFRCVVEDEVWTLTIHEPEGKLRELTDICLQIINDVEANIFNKSKYAL